MFLKQNKKKTKFSRLSQLESHNRERSYFYNLKFDINRYVGMFFRA